MNLSSLQLVIMGKACSQTMTPKYKFNINFTVKIINHEEWVINTSREHAPSKYLLHTLVKNRARAGAGIYWAGRILFLQYSYPLYSYETTGKYPYG